MAPFVEVSGDDDAEEQALALARELGVDPDSADFADQLTAKMMEKAVSVFNDPELQPNMERSGRVFSERANLLRLERGPHVERCVKCPSEDDRG